MRAAGPHPAARSTFKESPIHYILRRGKSEHRVDTDVWLCALDLAAVRGFGAKPDLARPAGIEVGDEDAQVLAQSLEAQLPSVPDVQIPLTDQAFGEEHTESLLARRVDGKNVADRDALAAREILSGSPKQDAARLAEFLKGGAFSVDAR